MAYDAGKEDGIAETTEFVVALLEDRFWHNIKFPNIHENCQMCEIIERIKKGKDDRKV